MLEAAAAVFHEKGYQAARIEDIATRVAILKGSLYYYIRWAKEDLLWFRPTGRLTYDDLGAFYRTFVLRGLRPGPAI